MAEVKAKSDALQKVLQEVGTKVYQQAAQEYAKQQGQQGQQPAMDHKKVQDRKLLQPTTQKVQAPKHQAKKKSLTQKTTK